jgi:8-oxo-dGTP diphosphatase
VQAHCEEGELHWIEEREVPDLNLWPGDRHFLPYVLARQPFLGTIWYRGPDVERHWVAEL